jgi:enolase-phosphatase E1
MMRLILTDIEGTTTSVSFVFDVLFPYFRERVQLLGDRLNDPAIAPILQEVKEIVQAENGLTLDAQGAIAQLHQWSVEDRKIAPLKALQGLLWEEGYKQGDFQGHIYADVPPNLEKWSQQGLQLGVYSSGSEYAQKLLFGYSEYGDLTRYFSWYFDLKVGQKRSPTSYQEIAKLTAIAPAEILFLSDIEAELDAAQEAGLQTIQLVREGTTASTKHQTVLSFDEISVTG